MKNALLEYTNLIDEAYKLKNTIAHFKGRRDKDAFEYTVIAYAEINIKIIEKQIVSLKKKWNITY